jgi:hypothetical protein
LKEGGSQGGREGGRQMDVVIVVFLRSGNREENFYDSEKIKIFSNRG